MCHYDEDCVQKFATVTESMLQGGSHGCKNYPLKDRNLCYWLEKTQSIKSTETIDYNHTITALSLSQLEVGFMQAKLCNIRRIPYQHAHIGPMYGLTSAHFALVGPTLA